MKRKIGILTGGGDCPGLNAVIRAVAKKAIFEHNCEVIGFEDGYDGLIYNRFKKLSTGDVSGILTMGGTILGTSNIANPYRHALKEKGNIVFQDISKQALDTVEEHGLECLFCLGGDGTMYIGNRLYNDGVPVIGIPKTIDNDLRGTDITFGFDSAVTIATEGIDRVHTTAQSHHRIMIVEVMGRKAGWIALYAGVAGGGDILLLPEIPYSMEAIVRVVKKRHKKGKRFSIIVVAEGAKPVGGDVMVKKIVKESTDPVRLGGIGFVIGDELERLTGLEVRTVVMGHLQRGGSPTPFDRILATRLGAYAVDAFSEKQYGKMVSVNGNTIDTVDLSVVAEGAKTVPLDFPLIRYAREIGASFGE